MRPEIQNAIRLIESGSAGNVEMALYSLSSMVSILRAQIYPDDQNDEIAIIIHAIMKQAFRKYFRPFGIRVRDSALNYTILTLETEIGYFQYTTTKPPLLFTMIENPRSWKDFVSSEVEACLCYLMTDPMNANDWKP
jgi:hypothetical protein